MSDCFYSTCFHRVIIAERLQRSTGVLSDRQSTRSSKGRLGFASIVMRVLWFCLVVTGVFPSATVRAENSERIQPYPANPYYWQYKGKPVLLLGGSVEENLFQIPALEQHLDLLVSVGGNYIRNTMNSGDEGNVWPFHQRADGRYDLETLNEEYFRRFERLLRLTAARDIIVQIELWDRFDFARDLWTHNPYNPRLNVNYTAADSRLRANYPNHPGGNENPFFRTVPALENNHVVLKYQQAQVDKMLSLALEFGNVLYCIDNETSAGPEWGAYWADYIRKAAARADVSVQTTEMWDQWDPKTPHHRRTFDHPELYSFIDVSQNNHNRGQAHFDNLQWVRAYIARAPRPINTVKTYGADGGRFGNDRDGQERFWRNVMGGAASARFHRPDSGLGLSETAQANLKSARLLTAELELFRCTPDAPSKLLTERDENEAYLTCENGRQYAVYFPNGGAVTLDLAEAPRAMKLKWLDIAASRWTASERIEGGGRVHLTAPGRGQWTALVIRDE